jgi:hypothetical protein
MKANFDFLLHHFFCFGVMPLFTIAGDLDICVLWTHFYTPRNEFHHVRPSVDKSYVVR